MNEQRAIGAGAAAADAEAARMKAYGNIGSGIASLGATITQNQALYKKTATPPDISKGFTINGSKAPLSSGFNPANQSPIGDRFSSVGSSFTGNAALTIPQINSYQGNTYQAQYEALKNKENIYLPYQAQYEDFLKQQQLQQAQYNTYIDAFGQQQHYKAY